MFRHTLRIILLFTASLISNAHPLQDLYHRALHSDPTYQSEIANYQNTMQDLHKAIGPLLPQVSFSARVDGTRAIFKGSGQFNYHEHGTSFNVDQTLLNPAQWFQVSQARLSVAAAQATLTAHRQHLILRLANAYFAVLLAEDSLRYTRSEYQALYKQWQQTKARFNVGMLAITSLHEAKAALDQVQAKLIDAQNYLDDVRANLAEILGYTPPTHHIAKAQLPPPNSKLHQHLQNALTHNPTLLAARLHAAAAHKGIRIAASGHLPTLSAHGSIAYQQSAQSSPFITSLDVQEDQIGLSLHLPLFNGGYTSAAVQSARAQWHSANHLAEAQKRYVLNHTRQYYLDLIALTAKLRADRQSIRSSKSALKSSQAAYHAGTRTILDVLAAERDLYAVLRLYAADQYHYLTRQLEFKAMQGQLSEKDLMRIRF